MGTTAPCAPRKPGCGKKRWGRRSQPGRARPFQLVRLPPPGHPEGSRCDLAKRQDLRFPTALPAAPPGAPDHGRPPAARLLSPTVGGTWPWAPRHLGGSRVRASVSSATRACCPPLPGWTTFTGFANCTLQAERDPPTWRLLGVARRDRYTRDRCRVRPSMPLLRFLCGPTDGLPALGPGPQEGHTSDAERCSRATKPT